MTQAHIKHLKEVINLLIERDYDFEYKSEGYIIDVFNVCEIQFVGFDIYVNDGYSSFQSLKNSWLTGF
ncbi:hypothetical protein [Endozoicomonas sp. ALB032]|uniref:hypothetical protein n=1 Tax=Endozoicomonas sp. ALB032 TaxID=3403082 RepID=UPI003BB4B9F9